MDQDTTPAATTAEPSDAPARTDEESTAARRRNSSWGKVQVSTKTAEPAKPELSKPERAKSAPTTSEAAKAEPTRSRSPRSVASDTAATDAPETDAPETDAPERPKPQRQPRQPGSADNGDAASSDAGVVEGSDAAEGATGTSTGTRRRRSRGGRGRGRSGSGGDRTGTATAEATEVDAPAEVKTEPKPRQQKPRQPKTEPATGDEKGSQLDAAAEQAGETSTGPKKRRRRGGRGRGGKKPATTETDTEATEAQRDEATPDADEAGAAKPRRRRSGKRPDQPAPKEAPKSKKPKTIEEQIAAGGPTRGIRTTRTRTGRDGRRRREQAPPPPRITDKLMAITEHGERDQIAVLEEDILVQHYVTRAGATSMVGNVYLGRVQNVLPGMEAAFVDVGRGRNGVLYAGEVNYSPEDIEGPAPRIEQLLKAGQSVMVQVTKDPMGGKGARLTANLSLAGRYLVLAPNQNLQGISRRLGDDARKRLKSMLKRVKPPEHGVIVRTAAEGATEEALEDDLRRLLDIWNDIQKKAKKGKAPTGLYEEPELTVRVVRDLFTDEEFKGLVTDSRRVYEKIEGYLSEVAPDLAKKVSLHDGSLPVFEEHRIVEQIHKALDKKVWLPSGGYLFIERTEAMTIVDVNTGKSVGKTNLEATVVNTNLEAAREVARQLRLRDIGGIIVIDFIDMLLEKNKKQVEDTMREALALDKTRSQVFEIGPLGLMQVTRKRVSSGLVESFSETCPTCEGRGIILTYDVH
ncbi:MAG TPA: Rne/Rng family ribonuclease [Actinomycetota bacterium]|nr:Rne/Rng family ribonuclease [Actinomycetota bacterium]